MFLGRISVVIFLTVNCLFADANMHNHKIIPRRVLFGNPDKTMVRISHDGKYISYLAPKNEVLNIWIAESDNVSNAVHITDDKDRGIAQYFWAYDNKHILYLKDNKGDENYRLYSYNIETGVTKLLSPKLDVKTVLYKASYIKPNEILIGLNDRDKQYFDLYRLNLNNSHKELIFKNDRFSSFVIDNNLKLRFASTINVDGDKEYFENCSDGTDSGDGSGSIWKSFMKVSMEDAKTTHLIGFGRNDTVLYLLDSRTSNTSVLKAMDLLNMKSNLIAQDSKTDIDIFTTHPTDHTIQGVVAEYEKKRYQILDESISGDIKYLQGLEDGELTIVNRTLDDKTWIVAYANDISPVRYYKYHRDTQKAEFLFTNKQALENYTMSAMTPVIIRSRDGLDLVSYLTLPRGVKPDIKQNQTPDKPLPLVLVVHGGPWSRDDFGFNAIHQWLSNRGYAALSVNFRGSTGFGKNFINSGNKEWGGRMQDDLIDAVNWAVNAKIVDPTRVCIMGGSYGGYAALVGLTFTPDFFACGIDIVGPSNILTLINSIPPYWKPTIHDFKKRIGEWDSEDGKEFLRQKSPLTFAHKIIKPLLIAQGANDPRVKKAESDQIVSIMRKHKIPVTYVLYQDEGHGFVRQENKLSFYAIAEEFLSKTLGGFFEPIGDDFKGANFIYNP